MKNIVYTLFFGITLLVSVAGMQKALADIRQEPLLAAAESQGSDAR